MAKNNNLYLQALETLKKDILNGTYPFQSKLPSEEILSNELNISRTTLRKILKVLNDEGLIESRHGSGSFVCNKSINRYIPVIIPKNNSNYRMMEIFEGSHDYFEKIGFSSLLTLTEGDPQKEIEIINRLIADGHKNFIIYPTSCDGNAYFYQSLLKKGCNCVFIDTLPRKITCDYVTSCNFLGAYEATKKLISLGHKDIAFCSIPDPKLANTIDERYAGYVSAIEQHELKVSDNVFILKDMVLDEFADHIVKNMTSNAIFASTDELAIILLNKFAQLNKHPAIIGFDNTILAESFNLASINQNLYEIGYTAAKILHKRIVNPSKSYEHVYIPISLIERSSLNSANQL